MNPKFNPADLAQFTGTGRYYRLNRKCLLTDATTSSTAQARLQPVQVQGLCAFPAVGPNALRP